MAKRFNKMLTTDEQFALYNKYNDLKKECQEAEKQMAKNYRIYSEMEGMFSIGTVENNFCGMGVRSFDYKYSNNKTKETEYQARRKYYEENVAPLKKRVSELTLKMRETNDALCISCGDTMLKLIS